MPTIATLGIEANSSSIPKAVSDVDRLTASVTKADAAVENFGKATTTTSTDISKLDAGIIRTNELLERLSQQTTYTNAQLTKLNSGASTGATQHIPRFTKALNDNAVQAGLTANQMLNLSRQGNDALTMFAMGAAPMQIFASQAGQIYGALQEGPGGVAGALKSVRDSLLGVIRSFPIATGLIAAGAAAWAVYELAVEDVKSLDEILEEHQKNIESIGDSWDAARTGAKSYTDEGITVFERLFGRTKEDVQERLAQDIEDIMGQIRTELALQEPFDSPNVPQTFRPFIGLAEQLENGEITVGKFREEVVKLGQARPELEETADRLLDITEAANETARAAADIEDTSLALVRLHDAISRVQSEPLRDELMKMFEQVKEGSITFKELDKLIIKLATDNPSFSGIIDGLRDLAVEAWNAGEGLRRAVDAASGTPTTMRNRLQRVRLPGGSWEIPIPEARPNAEDVLAAQEKAAAKADKSDPYKDVLRSADQRIRQMETELSLFGQMGAAAEELRTYQELLNRATKDGNEIGAEQQKQLRERAHSIALLTEAMKAAKLQQDLMFEREQLGRSSGERAIAQRLRGTGYGMDSPAADFMRDTNRREQMQEDIKGFFTDIRSGLMSGKPIGEALAESILNSFNKAMDKAIDNLFERAANALVDLLLGPSQSLGMPVSALGGLGGGNGLGGMTQISSAGVGALGGGSVASQAWNFFKSKGLADHQVAGILGNVKAESNFNPSAIGDGGLAHGLFQHHPNRGGGPGLIASGATGQLEHAWNELQGPESGVLRRLMAAPDVRSATAAFGGFERPQGWSAANPEAMHNFSGRLAGAESALQQFSGTTLTTAQNLQGGLGKLGETLSTGLGGAQGASSGGGWLSSLFGFGGAGGASLSPAAWGVVSGGMLTGLFHEGGIAGHASRMRMVHPSLFANAQVLHNGGIAGDEVPAILKRGERVLPLHQSQNGGSDGGGKMKVEIEMVGEGYNIKPSVRRIVHEDAPGIARQEVVGTLGKYNDEMRKGGQAKQSESFNQLRAHTRYG
jgi:hypothetical protein